MSDNQTTSNPSADQHQIQRPLLGFYKAFPGRGVRASVFQNQNSQTGRHYSTVTYSRSYQDENGEWQNSSTLRGWEQSQMSLLVHEASKLQNELDRINMTVDREQGLTHDRHQQPQTDQSEQVQPANGLVAQRDAAMANRAGPESSPNSVAPEKVPQHKQTPEM